MKMSKGLVWKMGWTVALLVVLYACAQLGGLYHDLLAIPLQHPLALGVIMLLVMPVFLITCWRSHWYQEWRQRTARNRLTAPASRVLLGAWIILWSASHFVAILAIQNLNTPQQLGLITVVLTSIMLGLLLLAFIPTLLLSGGNLYEKGLIAVFVAGYNQLFGWLCLAMFRHEEYTALLGFLMATILLGLSGVSFLAAGLLDRLIGQKK